MFPVGGTIIPMSAVNANFAIFWLFAGGACACEAARTKGRGRAFFISIGLVFIVFAVSDVIEVFTGAWWHPWWLLLVKVLCGVALLALAFIFRNPSTAHKAPESNTE